MGKANKEEIATENTGESVFILSLTRNQTSLPLIIDNFKKYSTFLFITFSVPN
jgi:hypothetical protein